MNPALDERGELRFLPLGFALCLVPGPCAAESLDAAVRAQAQQNLELLGNSWAMARERKRAISALQEAAARVRHGKIDLNIARMQMSLENWADAAKSFADRAR
ncbi:MAG: hypothetical protein ACHBNF_05140 [Chromatiales bacterium]